MRIAIAVSALLTLVGALSGLGQAPVTWADILSCSAVYNDPTIATCTCICDAGTLFPGCNGLHNGTTAATPNQCPDMLQGRRMISRSDSLAVQSPRFSGSADTVAITLVYETENDSHPPGLGVINGNPIYNATPNVGCRAAAALGARGVAPHVGRRCPE